MERSRTYNVVEVGGIGCNMTNKGLQTGLKTNECPTLPECKADECVGDTGKWRVLQIVLETNGAFFETTERYRTRDTEDLVENGVFLYNGVP
ncbi:Atp-Sensitive Inward Rectifier Potassium Channel 12 [Manis pentadactyla]|nr:Atp-Sensitive Inward Rectifier Potassium Channel 12 [Manis pentadactyla]